MKDILKWQPSLSTIKKKSGPLLIVDTQSELVFEGGGVTTTFSKSIMLRNKIRAAVERGDADPLYMMLLS